MNMLPRYYSNSVLRYVELLANLLRQVPIGPWPKDKKLKEIGRFEKVQTLHAVKSFTLASFTRVLLGHSLDHTQMVMEGVTREFCDRTLHLYKKRYFVYGRKAEQ